MANELTGLKIKDTYARVVQVVSGSYYDGLGNPLIITGSQGLQGPSGSVGIQGPPGPSGSNANIDTGSFVTTSSFNSFTSSYTTGSFTGSFTGNLNGTASDASSAISSSYSNISELANLSVTASVAIRVVVDNAIPSRPGLEGEIRIINQRSDYYIYAFIDNQWRASLLT